MSKRVDQAHSKRPPGHVIETSNDAHLPEATPYSYAKRESYLKTLQHMAGYVDRFRCVLEAAYDPKSKVDWRSECHGIRRQLAQQIQSETSSVRVLWGLCGSTNWRHLEECSDDHPLVDLYMNICGIIESLEERAEATKALRKGDLTTLASYWSGFGRAGQKEVARSPFGLEVSYNPNEMRSRPKDLRGAFYHERGLIVILEQAERAEKEATRQHERIHALVAGACDFKENLDVTENKSLFNRLISRINSKKRALCGFNKFKGLFHPTAIVDMTHEELLAELPNARAALEATGEKGYTGVLATAGHFIDQLTKHLTEQSAKVYNAPYRNEIARTAQDIRTLFQSKITAWRQAYFVAKQLSADHVREVEALTIALRPSQWHHLNSYLDHRVSKEVTEPIRDVFLILNELVEVRERELCKLREFGVERLYGWDKTKMALLLSRSMGEEETGPVDTRGY
jgi:hypothetical protein